jgi:hypothetical protein
MKQEPCQKYGSHGNHVPKQPSAQVQPTQDLNATIAAGRITPWIATRGIGIQRETSEYATPKGFAKTSEAELSQENASPTSEHVSPKAYHCQRHNRISIIQDAEMKESKGAKKHIGKSEIKASMISPTQSIHAATLQRRDNALDESHAMKKFEYSRRRKP